MRTLSTSSISIKSLIIIIGMVCSPLTMGLSANINNSAVFQVVQSQEVFDSSTVESATINPPKTASDSYGVYVKLKPAAASKFSKLTQENVGKQTNILLNGTVISSSTIVSKLGSEFLVGGLTKDQANQFVKSLGLKG